MSLKSVHLFLKPMLLNNSVIISSKTVITFLLFCKRVSNIPKKPLQSYTAISKIVL